jgi:hypothetical protein
VAADSNGKPETESISVSGMPSAWLPFIDAAAKEVNRSRSSFIVELCRPHVDAQKKKQGAGGAKHGRD